MRPNISNCHALPGTLVIFEGADGSGKSTQIKILDKLLKNEGYKVVVSEWKNAPIIGDFLKQNESLKKFDERILPETSLFLQSADMLYRIEREIIPALKKNQIVIMDRALHTIVVRGLMLGMTEDQLTKGLLWWRNTIYKEIFDKAVVVEIDIKLEESMERLQKRERNNRRSTKKKLKGDEGTLLSLHFINSLIYSSDGEKMTRKDKKAFVRKTQAKIIDTYNHVFDMNLHTKRSIKIDGNLGIKEISKSLKQEVIDGII